MNTITTVFEVGNNRHCFLERTASVKHRKNYKATTDDGILVYELEAEGGRTVYLSTQGKQGELVSGDNVQLNGLYANLLGLKHDTPLLLKRIKSQLSTVRKVHVEPLSADDWEILEQNSGRVETVLLDQIRVVWPDQVFPVWVQRSVHIFVKITSLEPMSYCLLLENNTEIVVAPKVRTFNPPKSLGISGVPHTAAYSGFANQIRSPASSHKTPTPTLTPGSSGRMWFQEEQKSSSHENLDTLEPRPGFRSPNRSPRSTLKKSTNKKRGSLSDPLGERQQRWQQRPMLRRESSLMGSVMKYVFSFIDKQHRDDYDTFSESDTSSGIDFSSQCLPARSGVLRIQPMKQSTSIEECGSAFAFKITHAASSKDWHSPRNKQQRVNEENAAANMMPYELFQPSTVYVDAESFTTERELHPFLPRLPNNFIARLQRLPSPQEKAQAAHNTHSGAKKSMTTATTKDTASTASATDKNPVGVSINATAAASLSKKADATKTNPQATNAGGVSGKDSDPISDYETPMGGSCFVRVVVIDRKAALTDKAWKDAADKLLTEQPLMLDHVIIPDLLRRQLKLDTTGSVWLQTGTIDIVIPKKVNVYQLTQVPYNISNEMLEKAFRAYIRLCADVDHPLVIFQGIFIKFPVQPELTVEVQVTFFGENDLSNPTAISMLSEQNIDSVLVFIERNLKTDKMGVVNPTLVFSKTSHFDLHPPTVKLKHLGGTEAVAKRGLAFLQACVGSRPLSRSTFRPRRGLAHGALLVTGPRGSGKSSLVKALCRKMAQIPTMAHTTLVDCKTLRGKTVATIQKILEAAFDEAAWREPAIIVFDNLDVIVPACTGPEGDMNAEALYSAKNAEVLQGFIKYEMENNSRLAVIATAVSKNSIHPTLISYSGIHYFQVTLHIGSPDKTTRDQILTRILLHHSSVSNETLQTVDFEPIVARTEGYVARDFEVLVNRAVHNRLTLDREAHKEKITLTQEDFEIAQEKFRPVSMRGVTLHKAGELGWADVGGLEEVKRALVETLRWPAKYPGLFSSCPLRLRSGILLYGAPGTGKTLLAGVVAKECGLNFISIKGPELLRKYIGASEQAVRDIFTRATSAKPCILFFDEFDSIAPKRGHDSTGVTDRVVNQFLTQLDGVEGLDGVYVLGATSRPDLIDPALLRPGRLDKSLQCCIPTEEERHYILEALTRKMCLGMDVDLQDIAAMCPFFTGADLKALLYNAQLHAIHENAKQPPHLDDTVLRIKGDDNSCPAIKEAVQLFKEDFQTKLSAAREKSMSEKNSPTKAHEGVDRKASGTSEESTSGGISAENAFENAMAKVALEKGIVERQGGVIVDLSNNSNVGDVANEEGSRSNNPPFAVAPPTPTTSSAGGRGGEFDSLLVESRDALTRAMTNSVGFDVDGETWPDLEDVDNEGFDSLDGVLTPVSEQGRSLEYQPSSWLPFTSSSPLDQRKTGEMGQGDVVGGGVELTSPVLSESFTEEDDNLRSIETIWESDTNNKKKTVVPSLTFDHARNSGDGEEDDFDSEDYETTLINKLNSIDTATAAGIGSPRKMKGSTSTSMLITDPSLTYPPNSHRKRSYERTQSIPAQSSFSSSSNSVTDTTDSKMTFLAVEKPVTVFTSLEHGLATLSPEDEERYLNMMVEIRRRDDRLFEAANNKRRTSFVINKRTSNVLLEVCQRHLEEAARNMRPSVTVEERKKYHNIYNKFVSSRTGKAQTRRDTVDAPLEKRATLA